MICVNEEQKTDIAAKTGILQYAGKLGRAIVDNGIAKAIPLAGELAAKGGWLGKFGVGCSKLLGKAGTFMAGPLGPVLGEIVGQLVIYAATNAFAQIAKKLCLIKEDDSVEEIGYRLEEAAKHDDWKRREDFHDFGGYYSYLRAQIPDETIDRNRLQSENLYFTTIGGDALRQSVAEHYSIDIPVDMLIEIGRCQLTGDTLQQILEQFDAEHYDISKFKDYLQGNLKGEEKFQIEQTFAKALERVYPEWDASRISDKLLEMKQAARDDNLVANSMAKGAE